MTGWELWWLADWWARREASLREDPEILVWFGTWVELESALNRWKCEGGLGREEEALARRRLDLRGEAWSEVEPTERVRERALRLLRVHPLRAADALQRGAALVACSEQPRGWACCSGDARLKDAALAEGFGVE